MFWRKCVLNDGAPNRWNAILVCLRILLVCIPRPGNLFDRVALFSLLYCEISFFFGVRYTMNSVDLLNRLGASEKKTEHLYRIISN